MELNQFTVGKYFFTAHYEWLCVDIGTKCVLAIKKEDKTYKVRKMKFDDTTRKTIPSSEEEIEVTDSWEDVEKVAVYHPDLYDIEIFWKFELDGCMPTEAERNEQYPLEDREYDR